MKLIIGIDIRPALKKMTGVGTYIYNLSCTLINHQKEYFYKLLSYSYKDRFTAPLPEAKNYHLFDKKIPGKLLDFSFDRFNRPSIQLFIGRIDIFHSHSPIFPPLRKCKKVITVHDLYFLKSPNETQKASVDLFRKRIKQHLDSADGIIAASHSTASDIIDIFNIPNERINVVYHGADHVRKISEEEKKEIRAEIRKKMGIPLTVKILLFVGTIEPRKNPVLLLKVFNRLVDKYKKDLYLVYGGDMGWGRDEFLYELNRSSYRDSIHITGYLNRNELDRLYTIADIFILPSNYEGFGFPLLEAMRCGIPAITANNSSLPEIGADAALYFETRNVDSLIEKIELLLGDNNLADDLSRRGKRRSALFTWEKTAAETVKVYESI